MDTFSYLSKDMQDVVWSLGWKQFTPIQEVAIPAIIQTNQHVVLSSATASGKTEAAFLPILSLVGHSAQTALKVLYISPLKALINNQYERIERITTSLDISLHRWHGDVGQHQKKKLLKNPSGILQLTPESLESIFINYPQYVARLFANIEFIVIDELHAFLDDARGVHLRSLLARIQTCTTQPVRFVCLSATLSNMDFVKHWIAPEATETVTVLRPPTTKKELYYHLMHHSSSSPEKDNLQSIYQDMYDVTKNMRSLIFCNSRAAVEETTVWLNDLAVKDGRNAMYYAHHSSIDKHERTYVEGLLAQSGDVKSIVATSSLELGIDIGSIELVVQLDSTASVSSLKQRLGRAGRTHQAPQYLQLYTTNTDHLLQSLAVLELHKEKWVEPSFGYATPYDVLFHQVLSICGAVNGMTQTTLLTQLEQNPAFFDITKQDMEQILSHMMEHDFLEQLAGSEELIVGLTGERILRSREFYSVFTTEATVDVFAGTRKVGELNQKFSVNVGDCILLNGKPWRIIGIDTTKNQLYVEPAYHATKPRYYGGAKTMHADLVEKMYAILTSTSSYDYLNEEGANALHIMRNPYHTHQLQTNERPIWHENDRFMIECFTGSRIVTTLLLMLRSFGVMCSRPDGYGHFSVEDEVDIIGLLDEIKEKNWTAEELLPFVQENEWVQSKFSVYLTRNLQVQMHIAHALDIQATQSFLQNTQFRLL